MVQRARGVRKVIVRKVLPLRRCFLTLLYMGGSEKTWWLKKHVQFIVFTNVYVACKSFNKFVEQLNRNKWYIDI